MSKLLQLDNYTAPYMQHDVPERNQPKSKAATDHYL